MIIAVDIGYGYTKGINENNNKVVFPSLVTAGYDREMETILGAGIKDMDSLHIKLGNEEYFVGELARRSRLASVTLDSHKVEHKNTQILLAASAGLLGEGEVYLVTGLPYEDFKHQKNKLIQTLRGKEFNISYFGGPFEGEKKFISVKDIIVFPQGAGALYASSDILYIQSLARSGKMVSIIDVGYKTTDIVTFEAGNSLTVRDDISGTIDAGVSDIEKAVLKRFFVQTGKRLDISKAAKIINDGGIDFKGEFLDLTDTIEKAKILLSSAIKDKVKIIWDDSSDFICKVYLAGGGALMLQNNLKELNGNTTTILDSQFANVKGFLEVGRNKFKR